jgi:hypothetical protein
VRPDAGNRRTWRRDTRTGTAGWRFALLPASARSKRELLETRDARYPRWQELRQPERAGISENPHVFTGSPPLNGGNCGISPVGAENSPTRIGADARDRRRSDRSSERRHPHRHHRSTREAPRLRRRGPRRAVRCAPTVRPRSVRIRPRHAPQSAVALRATFRRRRDVGC